MSTEDLAGEEGTEDGGVGGLMDLLVQGKTVR